MTELFWYFFLVNFQKMKPKFTNNNLKKILGTEIAEIPNLWNRCQTSRRIA